MASKHNAQLAILALAATLLSGAAVYFGAGLHPHWWLMWVAALPILLVAPRLSWSWTLLVAFAASALGALSLWNYLRQLFPLPVIVAYLFVPGAAFALAVLLFRDFFRRGQVWLAVLAFPSLIVAYEYISESALGTYGNVAYTQLNNLPVLQLAALTGMWGIGFVVMLFAPAKTVAILSRGATRRELALNAGRGSDMRLRLRHMEAPRHASGSASHRRRARLDSVSEEPLPVRRPSEDAVVGGLRGPGKRARRSRRKDRRSARDDRAGISLALGGG